MTRLPPEPYRWAIWAFIAVVGLGLPFLTTMGPIAAGNVVLTLFQLFHGLVLGGIVVVWMLALLYTCGDEEPSEPAQERGADRDRPARAA